jgi:hypothetical protein
MGQKQDKSRNKQQLSRQPQTTPQFERAIKALANTPPISNQEIVKRKNSRLR